MSNCVELLSKLSSNFVICPFVVEISFNFWRIIEVFSNCSRIVLKLMSNCVEFSRTVIEIISNCCRILEMLSKFCRNVVEFLSNCCWIVDLLSIFYRILLAWCRNFLELLLNYRFSVDLLSNCSRVDVEILSICCRIVKFLPRTCWIVQIILTILLI